MNEPNALYKHLENYCRREGTAHQSDAIPPVVQIQLVGTLAFDAGSLDQAYMEEIVRTHFQPVYERVDNHTNDQDYIHDGGDIDERDRSTWYELERRIFEDLVSRDNRYLATKEQWSVVLADLKQMTLQKDNPALIAQFLREKRAELLGV